ncbi:MAG: DUF6216 family protein [Pseudomonadota bacterium]
METLLKYILENTGWGVISTVLISIFILLMVLGWLMSRRIGSVYSIYHRFWYFIFGTGQFNNSKIKDLVDDRIDIERFNMIFNIRAVTIEQIIRFKSWIDINEIDVAKITRASKYFDIQKLTIKPIKKYEIIFFLAIFVSMYYVLLMSVSLYFKNSVIYKFNESGYNILLSEKKAEPFFYFPMFTSKSEYWNLSKEKCTKINEIILTENLTKERVDAICEEFLVTDFSTNIGNEVRDFKLAISIVITLSLILIIFSWVFLYRYFCCLDAIKEIKNKCDI